MQKEKPLTHEEFKKAWTQEASNQPGLILDVLAVTGLRLKTKTPPLESKKAS